MNYPRQHTMVNPWVTLTPPRMAVLALQREARYCRAVKVHGVATENSHWFQDRRFGTGSCNKVVTYYLATDAQPSTIPQDVPDDELFMRNEAPHRYHSRWVDEDSVDTLQYVHDDFKGILRRSFEKLRNMIREGRLMDVYPPSSLGEGLCQRPTPPAD